MTDRVNQKDCESEISPGVIESVQANHRLLQQLLAQVSDLHQRFGADSADPQSHRGCEDERMRLLDLIDQLESQLDELREQNRELAAKVAGGSVRKAIAGKGPSEALSWEQRKQLILQQLEEESFDGDAFVASLSSQPGDLCGEELEPESPQRFVERLVGELESRNQEINELRHLLQQQSEARGTEAIGAAAVAQLIDSDELVRQERERLQRLQAEWEEKFREGEIEASLERAKLSRERQELAKKQAELEEGLEQLRRELHQKDGDKGAASRRWLVKLGLIDHS